MKFSFDTFLMYNHVFDSVILQLSWIRSLMINIKYFFWQILQQKYALKLNLLRFSNLFYCFAKTMSKWFIFSYTHKKWLHSQIQITASKSVCWKHLFKKNYSTYILSGHKGIGDKTFAKKYISKVFFLLRGEKVRERKECEEFTKNFFFFFISRGSFLIFILSGWLSNAITNSKVNNLLPKSNK